MRPFVYKAVLLVLLSSFGHGQLPEDDFRIINKQDLLAKDSDIFEDRDSKSFSQLLFDVARDQVIVGARDAIYRLSLRGLKPFEKAQWPAAVDKVKLCQVKGQTEDDCHNYVKVLLSSGNRIFACGTNAFSPQCSWREIESISTVLEWVTGVANCPYNPHSNVTALLSSTGEYYTGTPTDFSGSDTAICRSRGENPKNTYVLRTSQYDLNWLNEPQFVGSFEHDQFVYFVFREVAVEYMNCGKIVYSRIARVCKNDNGGHLMMRDKWSTFLKARLSCSIPGDYSFDYDEVQSIHYVDDQQLLVAVFTTPDNSIAGSAVCVYNMSDVASTFDGPYKMQSNPTAAWEPRSPILLSKEHFRCKNNSSRHHDGIQYQPYRLMHEAVKPISGEPLYKATLERFTHITADTTLTKTAGRQFVFFVSTQNSDILKLAVLPRFRGACLVEIWKLRDERNSFEIMNLQFVKDTISIYVGTDRSVIRIGAQRCSRHVTRAACVGAADPYCGWGAGRCAHAALHAHDDNFAQTTDICPMMDLPVDGGWSSWSPWSLCVQESESLYPQYFEMEKPDMCMCRTRRCDNPTPVNGGKGCEGTHISVSNCTIHGSWSAWSAWSECSASCGIAVKSRRRSCTAPAPAHGGRVCVGQDSMEIICTHLPPCPDPEISSVDGGWSEWGPWTTCGGSGCGPGTGVRERRRSCTDPLPRHGGTDCEGPTVDRQPCDLKPCEVRKGATWTPWVVIPGNNSDGSYSQKRFKVVCKASTSEQIKLILGKEEEQYCTESGGCGQTPPEEGWGAWGEWGECSVSCGGGRQERSRQCVKCQEGIKEWKACNSMPCLEVVQVAGMSVSSTVSGIIISYIFGVLSAMVSVWYCARRTGQRLPWRRSVGVPSSPHYITAAPNSYVTMPLKPVPRKAKRQPSFSGISGASGTLLTKSNNLSNNHNHTNTLTTPKLYPKAIANEYDTIGTLRRHSHQPNNKANVDYEEEKFY